MSRVAHLAIGTEILLGQILNSNSQWLSTRLFHIGLTPVWHLSCRDIIEEIHEALEFLIDRTDALLVTGGLGPTTDDLTREALSDFFKLPLEWREEAWIRLTDYLNKRSIQVRKSHKKECYFPQESQIFLNPLGTACGFGFHASYCSKLIPVLVLPGPPRELESMWDEASKWLLSHFSNLDPMRYRAFLVIGYPESAVAERLDSALIGCPFPKGYRIDLPYIEFKLMFKESEKAMAEVYWKKALASFSPEERIFSKSELIDQIILKAFPKGNGVVFCSEPPSYLLRRFDGRTELKIIPWQREKVPIGGEVEWLEFDFENDNRVMVSWGLGDKIQAQKLVRNDLPPSHSEERRVKYLVEKALLTVRDITSSI